MKSILRALRYFAQDRMLIAIWLSCVGLQVSIELLQAWPTAVLVDAVLTLTPHGGFWEWLFLSWLPSSIPGQIIGLAIIALVMKVVHDVLVWIGRVADRRVELNGMLRARRELFDKFQELGPAYQRGQSQGDSVYRVSTDVDGFRIIIVTLIDAIFAIFSMVVMACIMFSRNIPLTIVAASTIPFLIGANLYFGPQVKYKTIRAKEADASYTSLLIRALSGIFVVKTYNREHDEFNRFDRVNIRSANQWQAVLRAQVSYDLVVQTVFSVAAAIIFGYGGYLVYYDQFLHHIPNGFTVGDIIVFMTYLAALWGPLNRVTGLSVSLKPGIAGVDRVFQVLDKTPVTSESANAQSIPVSPRTIRFDDVFFAYDDTRQILQGVSAQINPGEFVAFVGTSGAGKSTVLNLLPRFYDPQDGRIMLDDHNIRDLKLSDLRAHFACMSQDNLMLSGTIYENIAYGKKGATFKEVERMAALVGATEFIDELEGGFDAIVVDSGGNLSGGQRQRIALARALLSKAPILVLDEPTSALDPQHERDVTEAIQAERGKRTIIMVTHRLETVRDCDRIFVLDEGRIVESGTHQELSSANGLYRRLLEG